MDGSRRTDLPADARDRATSPVDRALAEVDAAISLVDRGIARTVVLDAVPGSERVAAVAVTHARAAGVGISLMRRGPGSIVAFVIGPRDTPPPDA